MSRNDNGASAKEHRGFGYLHQAYATQNGRICDGWGDQSNAHFWVAQRRVHDGGGRAKMKKRPEYICSSDLGRLSLVVPGVFHEAAGADLRSSESTE